jgi:hypothetical protein
MEEQLAPTVRIPPQSKSVSSSESARGGRYSVCILPAIDALGRKTMRIYNVTFSGDPSWDDCFTTLKQAQEYAAVTVHFTMGHAVVIDGDGLLYAQYGSPVATNDTIDAQAELAPKHP